MFKVHKIYLNWLRMGCYFVKAVVDFSVLTCKGFFYVSLTVHLGIILVINHLNAQILV